MGCGASAPPTPVEKARNYRIPKDGSGGHYDDGGHIKVWFDVEIEDEYAGRVECVLRDDIVPKTAENFRCLFTGEKGFGLKGTIFHRIIPGFMVQCGDITTGDGKGGKSIYGDKFDDENFLLKHTGPGVLSCANMGKNTNQSQFFVITKDQNGLNNKHVAFGYVSSGMDIIYQIEECSEDVEDGKPDKKVKIFDCGQIAEW